MKTRLNSLLFALLAGVGTMFATEGALSGYFSVGESTRICFSQGNLQYQASTDTWRFAENQYDMIGNDNANISASYSGWIDHFGWGTGNNPTLSSQDYNDYNTNTDWGTNAISNGGNEANLWRTLTKDEWVYLFYTRTNAANLFGLGSVNAVNGTIILPDNWVTPEGASFTASTTQGLTDQGSYYYDENGDHFGDNTYSAEQWAVMEQNGAVFLPAAGRRNGSDVYSVGSGCYFWSSTRGGGSNAWYLEVVSGKLLPQGANTLYYGHSVRLVQEKANSQTGGTTPTFPGDPGTLTLNLELKAAVMDGDEIQGYTPTGGGGYAKGTSVTITAQEIWGYKFLKWSDEVTENPRTIELNESMTLTALYSHSLVEIPVAANKWTFISLSMLSGGQYTEDMFSYDGLTDVQWGTYNGAKRAAGQSGWETPETFNDMQGYILYSSTAGTLRINMYVDATPNDALSINLTDYSSTHPENAGWNFIGNPYAQGYNIAGLAAMGIESPITVWNGTAYTTYTPGIDSYILNPFEAFFIQKAENGAEYITFSPEYMEGNSGSSVADEMGTLPGYFSVSATQRIRFAKGNLQYQASTDTWRFAGKQYDMIGEDNANISATYNGWIDLFGWGTGDTPTNTSKVDSTYTTFVDWGINAISNGGNEANLWRTLTKDEWGYLFYTRTNAESLFGLGSVNGINGIIILPDNWSIPQGASFTPSTTKGLADQGDYFSNSNGNNFSHNTYTAEQWSEMEQSGAVFLPAAGYRAGSQVDYVGSSGSYWSATPHDKSSSYRLYFDSVDLYPQGYGGGRSGAPSVRLVR